MLVTLSLMYSISEGDSAAYLILAISRTLSRSSLRDVSCVCCSNRDTLDMVSLEVEGVVDVRSRPASVEVGVSESLVEAANGAAAMTLLPLMLHLTFEGVDVEVVVIECSLDMSRGLLERQLGSSDEASSTSSTSFVYLFRPNMSASFASSMSTITTEDPVELSVTGEVDLGE